MRSFSKVIDACYARGRRFLTDNLPMRLSDFDRLYGEHADGLYAFLAYRLGDRVAAEDLLADTFERALRARGRYDRRRGSEKAWLYAIALNALRDHVRRRGAERRALERTGAGPEAGPDRSLEAVADRAALAAALEDLADEEREAIALRFGGDLTLPEIAGLLGEPLTTVEGRVYRALRKLRGRFER
jgi:RNA polymerase sigma-70 factor (ECF subfamily)